MRLPLHNGWGGSRLGRDATSEGADAAMPAARAAILAHLRASEASVVGGEPREAQQARDAMRDLCHDAHRRHLQAEQLLIAVKDAWRAMPEARTGARR